MPVRSTTPLPVILQGPRLAAQGGWDEYFCLITTGGTHTLRWKYTKDGSGSGGSDCAWVDHVQWSGDLPDPNGWQEIAYTYDPAGRRIAKAVEGQTQVKYLYDGDHCIAEYDSSDQLLQKFIHGSSRGSGKSPGIPRGQPSK